MIRMHKAAKFLNDVHKKKIGLGNKVDRVDNSKDTAKKDTQIHNAELISNNCCYCHKVFISPKFLLKHILRRHPEDLISLHRKCLKPEGNKNSSDFKGVLDFLQEEFSELRKELKTVKQACVNNLPEHDQCNVSKNELSSTNENCNELKQHVSGVKEDGQCNSTSSISVDDTAMNEIKLVKEKVLDMESNIQCLHKKFVELDAVVKGEVLSKQDIHNLIASSEDKILRAQEAQLKELRCNLLKNMHTMLCGQLQENNNEWKSQVLALNQEVQRLDHLVGTIQKQINSPDHLAAIEKTLEKHIVNFMGVSSRSKRKASKERNSRLKNNSSVTKQIKEQQRSERTFKISKYENTSKTIGNANKLKESTCYVSPNEFSFLLAEKMAHFGIPPGVMRLSDAEFKEKIKLINSDKEYYNKKWPAFSDICDKLNTYAEQRVIDKLNKRKSRKLRFSEPVTSEKISNYSSHENVQNKTYPILNDKNHKLSVCDAGGSGDSFWNFKELQCRSKQQLESTCIKESETLSTIDDSLNFQVENATELVKGSCLSSSSVPFSTVKQANYASLYTSKEQLDSNSAKPESLKPMENSRGPRITAQDSLSLKKYCSLSSLPFDTDKKTHCASVEVSGRLDYASDDSVVEAGKAHIKYPKIFNEDDDDNSSMKSLSSWESSENAS